MKKTKKVKEVQKLSEEQKLLLEQHLDLPRKFMMSIKTFIWRDYEEDFLQEMYLGMIRAANTYDPKKSAFPTHAIWQLRSALSNFMYKKNRWRKMKNIEDQLYDDPNHFSINDFSQKHFMDGTPVEENNKLRKFREIICKMPFELRDNLPNSRNLFNDATLRPDKLRKKNLIKRMHKQDEAIIFIIKAMNDEVY